MTRGQWDRSHLRLPIHERLERHIERVDGGCWLWTAATAQGYGVTTVGYKADGSQRRVQAHRLMYELSIGSIPDGLDLDHLCRVRRCVNPAHLEPVTRRENLLRGINQVARNAAKTHCKRGHPFDEVNTARRTNGTRNCRACNRIVAKARRDGIASS